MDGDVFGCGVYSLHSSVCHVATKQSIYGRPFVLEIVDGLNKYDACVDGDVDTKSFSPKKSEDFGFIIYEGFSNI